VVEVLTLEGVGDDRLVLDADLIGEAAAGERLNRAFELPRRSVRRRKREMPGDVVLENRRRCRRQRVADAGEVDESIDVLEDGVWRDPDDRDGRLRLQRRLLVPVLPYFRTSTSNF
jgi:hypothetical protein